VTRLEGHQRGFRVSQHRVEIGAVVLEVFPNGFDLRESCAGIGRHRTRSA
jgi:hypothetical protein